MRLPPTTDPAPVASGLRGRCLRHRASTQADTLALHTPTVPAHGIGPHRHTEAHLVLVLRGAYETDAIGPRPAPDEPWLVLNPPGTDHQDRFAAHQPLARARFASLQLSPGTWARWQAHTDLPTHACTLTGPGVRALAGRWQALLRCTASRLDPDDALALVPGWEPNPRPGPWLQQARMRLRDWALAQAAPPQLAHLAAALGVHPVSLSRGFRRAYGIGPGDYVRQLRRDQARAWLRHSRLPLAEVAALCGYCDQAHLARDLAAHGLPTPARYRRGAAPVQTIQDAQPPPNVG